MTAGRDSAERSRELVRARSALSVVQAHYWRALALAETAREEDRPAAFAEVHRLTTMAVALRQRAGALQTGEGEPLARARR